MKKLKNGKIEKNRKIEKIEKLKKRKLKNKYFIEPPFHLDLKNPN